MFGKFLVRCWHLHIPLLGVSEVCDIHPKLPPKVVRYYCMTSFLLFKFAFFFKWNFYTKSSSPILSKHYEAPKLSQNICVLIFHFLYVSPSN